VIDSDNKANADSPDSGLRANPLKTPHDSHPRRYYMEDVRSDVFEWLKINQDTLNEIELEDIHLEPVVQRNIYKTIAKMLSLEKPCEQAPEQNMVPIGDITCKGFWVENTKELVLYVWIGDQSRAIIVPQDGWNLRDDIIIN
jgi:hypothetical protein